MRARGARCGFARWRTKCELKWSGVECVLELFRMCVSYNVLSCLHPKSTQLDTHTQHAEHSIMMMMIISLLLLLFVSHQIPS